MGEFIGQRPEPKQGPEIKEESLLDQLVENALERFHGSVFKWVVNETDEVHLTVYNPFHAATDTVKNCGIDADKLLPTLITQTSWKFVPTLNITKESVCAFIVEKELSARHPEVNDETELRRILPIAG